MVHLGGTGSSLCWFGLVGFDTERLVDGSLKARLADALALLRGNRKQGNLASWAGAFDKQVINISRNHLTERTKSLRAIGCRVEAM